MDSLLSFFDEKFLPELIDTNKPENCSSLDPSAYSDGIPFIDKASPNSQAIKKIEKPIKSILKKPKMLRKDDKKLEKPY